MMTDFAEVTFPVDFREKFHETGLLVRLNTLIPNLPPGEDIATLNSLANNMKYFSRDAIRSLLNDNFLNNLAVFGKPYRNCLRIRALLPILTMILDTETVLSLEPVPLETMLAENMLHWGYEPDLGDEEEEDVGDESLRSPPEDLEQAVTHTLIKTISKVWASLQVRITNRLDRPMDGSDVDRRNALADAFFSFAMTLSSHDICLAFVLLTRLWEDDPPLFTIALLNWTKRACLQVHKGPNEDDDVIFALCSLWRNLQERFRSASGHGMA
jgi:hypothetical protein